MSLGVACAHLYVLADYGVELVAVEDNRACRLVPFLQVDDSRVDVRTRRGCLLQTYDAIPRVRRCEYLDLLTVRDPKEKFPEFRERSVVNAAVDLVDQQNTLQRVLKEEPKLPGLCGVKRSKLRGERDLQQSPRTVAEACERHRVV